MDIVRLAISKPVGVTVGVLLLVMFGLIGLTAIPVQLTPSVDRPEITVTTEWPGRSPQEIVDEITKEQEERLKNVSNLKTMTSVSQEGEAVISLEFYIGTDISRALQETSDALRQVPDYPDEVDEPTVKAADGASENAIAWIIIDLDPRVAAQHPDFDITTLFDRLDKEVKPFLERIDGVAEINIFGGREREVRVLADNEALALRNLNIGDLITALRGENTNVSAGSLSEGKRDYRVRVVGQFAVEEDVLSTVVAYRDGKPVYVRDVASVEFGHDKQRGFVRSFGNPSIAMNCIRQSGANVVDVMEELRLRLDEVRAEILPRLDPVVGPSLRMRQVYDETIYIASSIELVTQNLWVGGLIASVVLLLFLRSLVTTGVIALAIPISIVGTFLIMLGLGRTLNVISLAGLAFAVGMVVDNAIVVLENIYRRVQEGDSPMQAAYRGGREVWGAILASTLTTVAVFIPVLTIEEEAGQLFRDLSIAIVSSVVLSLVISITVIPAACSRWLRPRRERRGRARAAWEGLFGLGASLGWLVDRFGSLIAWLQRGVRGWTVRPLVIVVMAGLSLYGALTLAPPLDYLPAGNRNLVFGGMLIPPGLSVEEMTDYAQRIEGEVLPYMQHVLESNGEDPSQLPPIGYGVDKDGNPLAYDPVVVGNFFIGSFGGGMFTGATSAQEDVVIPVGQLLTNNIATLPDTFGGAQQSSLFGRGVGGGNTVDIEIMGPDLNRVVAAAERIMIAALTHENYGLGRVRPDPGNFNLGQPEVQVELTRQARELGLRTSDVGTVVRGLFDGAFVDDFKLTGESVDMVVVPSGGELDYLERMAEIPVATPAGPVVPLDTLVVASTTNAPQAIQRIEELPAVKLLITPPPGMAVQDVIAEVDSAFIQPARDEGLIDRTMRVRLEGTAAKLDEVQAALFGASGTGGGGGVPASGAALAARWLGLGVIGVGGLFALFGFARAIAARRSAFGYGGVGALLLLSVIGGVLFTFGSSPELAMARFVWALLVTYLLLCALFESFLYPFVIMFTVPLAVVGGFGGLAIVHAATAADPTIATQQLDVLTMLGFVILIGVVVNNAILIVHQTLNFMQGRAETGSGSVSVMEPVDAIAASVRTRVRPIFMSTMTSVGGMLPLVLVPGAGSEMYRGLGSVVIGGLLVATVFTLVLVPLLLGLMIDFRRGLLALLGRQDLGRSSAPPSTGVATAS
ncbi:MAG: efflux RND transporter permease subunit [Planctomycetota bacterium]